MIDYKHFDVEFQGNDIFIVQTDGPHGGKSRYFGRIYKGEDYLLANRGFIYEDDDVESIKVGKFTGTHAFEKAVRAIIKEYEESHIPVEI